MRDVGNEGFQGRCWLEQHRETHLSPSVFRENRFSRFLGGPKMLSRAFFLLICASLLDFPSKQEGKSGKENVGSSLSCFLSSDFSGYLQNLIEIAKIGWPLAFALKVENRLFFQR